MKSQWNDDINHPWNPMKSSQLPGPNVGFLRIQRPPLYRAGSPAICWKTCDGWGWVKCGQVMVGFSYVLAPSLVLECSYSDRTSQLSIGTFLGKSSRSGPFSKAMTFLCPIKTGTSVCQLGSGSFERLPEQYQYQAYYAYGSILSIPQIFLINGSRSYIW